MRFWNIKSLLILPLLWILSATGVGAKTEFRGNIGVDLESYSHRSSVKIDTLGNTRNYGISRVLSRHFLELGINGSVVNSNFANYSILTNIYGTYYRNKTDTTRFNEYQNPEINSFSGQLTLFPNRRYPLKLYRTTSQYSSLIYESSNREDYASQRPELAVIRRYDGEQSSLGAIWQARVSETFKMTTEIKQTRMLSDRIYDFEENRDIRLVTTIGDYSPLLPVEIIIQNKITDADILVLIGDSTFTINAKQTSIISIDPGTYFVEVIPSIYYRQLAFPDMEIVNDYVWTISFKDPLGSRDIEQTNSSAVLNLQLGDHEKLFSDVYYEYSDLHEAGQNISTIMNNFSNNAGYRLSPATNLTFLTSYNQNNTLIDTISSQLTKSFLHSSTLNYTKRKGWSGSLLHSFNRSISVVGGTYLSSDLNIFTAQAIYPMKPLKYTFNIKGNASLQKDNTEKVINQYSANIINSIETRFLGARLLPKNEIKYIHNYLEIPDQQSNEFETKLIMRTEMPRSKIFGDIIMRTEFIYRNKYDDIGSNITKKYYIDFFGVRSFGKKYRMTLMSSQQWEAYGGSTPTAGANPNLGSIAKATEYQNSYKIDLQYSPVPTTTISTGYMIIAQAGSQNRKVSLTLNSVVPFIKARLKSYLVIQSRTIGDSPAQVQTDSETKLSFNFRRITLVFTYTFAKEKLRAGTYTLNQIQGKITRKFDVF